MEISFTTVVGVDREHLQELKLTWPTWRRHKPSLLRHPMLAFFDASQVSESEVRGILDHPDLLTVPWPWWGEVEWPEGEDKWTHRQRHKMLAGFVYCSKLIDSKYILKLDTDAVATGQDDWIDWSWFDDLPAIVAHPWGYTKPPRAISKLQLWAVQIPELGGKRTVLPGLEYHVTLVRHPRIISWCGFFRTDFTRRCAKLASKVGEGSRGRVRTPTSSTSQRSWKRLW